MQAARCFQIYLREILGKVGLKPLPSDSATYFMKEGKKWIFMPTHVDDLFPVSNCIALQKKIFEHLSKFLKMKNLGAISFALKTKIETDHKEGVVKISCGSYIREVLERYGMENCKPVKAPMTPGSKWIPNPLDFTEQSKEEEKLAREKPIRQLVGALWWCVHMCRPDILYALHEYSKYMDKPTMKVWNELLMIVRYLKGTIDLGVVMKRPRQGEPVYFVEAYVDSDWAGCEIGRKSRSGGLVFFLGQLICWFSEMQTSIALSTCESECYGLVKMAKRMSWLKDLLGQIGLQTDHVFKVWCECKSTIDLCNNGTHSKRSRHFDIAVKVIFDYVKKEIMEMGYCPTAEMIADVFTKALISQEFLCWRSAMMGGISSQNHFTACVEANFETYQENEEEDEIDIQRREQKYKLLKQESERKRVARKRNSSSKSKEQGIHSSKPSRPKAKKLIFVDQF